ncbi:hypothetical protein TNCV_1943311 [Trichonephila clavipes]|nr:hypothetical protein TNCV_1943311 [Trichonephila clavipes]
MHEQQKDSIAKSIDREMHWTARFSLICITICMNMPLRGNSKSGPQVSRSPNMLLRFLRIVWNTFCSLHRIDCVGYRGSLDCVQALAVLITS